MNGGECSNSMGKSDGRGTLGEYTMREMWENFIRNLSASGGESSKIFQAFRISLPP